MEVKWGVGWNFMSWYHLDILIVKNFLKQTEALIQEGSMLFFGLAKGPHSCNKEKFVKQCT